VTALLRNGNNSIAIKALPSDPANDLVIHFIDWTQLPPDRNQGLFRHVQLANSARCRCGLRVWTPICRCRAWRLRT
jgi:hypothetical protein